MTTPIAFDLTRLFISPIQRTPRGIDRHDLGLARHFFNDWGGDCFGTLPTPVGVRCIARGHAVRILDSALENWGEHVRTDQDERFQKVRDRILNGHCSVNGPLAHTPRAYLHVGTAIAKMLRSAGLALGPLAAGALPKGTLYVNTGQVGIALPQFLSWLKRRPDIKTVLMLHDTIPMDHAEYVVPSSRGFHQNMVDCAARHAAALIVNSQAAETTIRRELARSGRLDIPVFREHLPVPDVFARGPDPDPALAQVPYFVIAGTIEPRKNHLLLLNIWRELVRTHDRAAPLLVIVGNRWREYEAITRILERSTALQNHVIEVAGLSSQALRTLMSNACGLLMPSFAEGFGLPIIEALAVGTPVVASDIPAHREAGGPYATYVSPIDGLGWLSAIRTHVRELPALRKRISGYKMRIWQDYVHRLDSFLLGLDAEEAISATDPSAVPKTLATSTAAPEPMP
jgi:glycosyltransferase involved in cell wall biosynthesis